MGHGWLSQVFLFAFDFCFGHVTSIDPALAFDVERMVSRGADDLRMTLRPRCR